MINELENVFEEFIKSNHHAFLLESKDRENTFNYFKDKIKELEKDINKQSLFINLQIFDINKARELLKYINVYSEHDSFIILSFYSMNKEAQNALLKVLEEPRANTKILLISNSISKILNTIISRVYKLNLNKEGDKENDLNKIVEKFLSSSKNERIKMKEIQEILNKKDEYAEEFEDKERVDREGIEKFLLHLHKYINARYENEKNKEDIENLKKLNEFIKYIKNNSSSGKTILEYLSLKL